MVAEDNGEHNIRGTAGDEGGSSASARVGNNAANAE